jgi:hypothetical protein
MPTCKAPDGVYDYGDVSGDGSIGFTDIVNIANHINGSVLLTGDKFIRADLNGDGIVDQADMDLLAAYIQNPGTVFPVCATGGIDPGITPSIRSLEVGSYDIVVTKSNYNPVYARINVSSTGQVSCTDAVCLASGYPRVEASGTSVKVYMAQTEVVSDVCAWITGLGGWKNIQWTSNVLEAYYVYIGATGHSVGFSPVTWDDVLGLYYYYINQSINDPSAGNAKTGCGFT